MLVFKKNDNIYVRLVSSHTTNEVYSTKIHIDIYDIEENFIPMSYDSDTKNVTNISLGNDIEILDIQNITK